MTRTTITNLLTTSVKEIPAGNMLMTPTEEATLTIIRGSGMAMTTTIENRTEDSPTRHIRTTGRHNTLAEATILTVKCHQQRIMM